MADRHFSADHIGAQLLAVMEQKGISDAALERDLGLTPKTVSNWRRGRSHSYMRYLTEVCDYLGISSGSLLSTAERGESLSLSEEETELLLSYRRVAHLKSSRRRALRETFSALVELYLKK